MNYDEWCEKFKPIKNDLDKHAGFDGCLFETYPPHIQEVKKALDLDSGKVWTLIGADDGSLILSSGYHFVNRLGYFITVNPSNEDMDVIVCEGEDDDDFLP